MPKTRNEYIREELNRDFDAPAADIVERLAKKGVRLKQQHVYQARSTMRHAKRPAQNTETVAATREEKKTMTLGTHILNVLIDHPEGLSDRDLMDAVKKAGYVSHSSDFLTIVRQRLGVLVEKGQISKNGLQYKLQGSALEQAETSRKRQIMSKTEEALNDYTSLREALIDYAQTKGFDSPETFPDALIARRRQLVEATVAYSSLFQSGSANNGKTN